MHIDVILNFMHILADLGFGGVFPIYIGSRKTCMPYNIYVKEYTCKVFQEPNEIQFGRKHQINQEESTPKCDTKKVVQIISKSKSTHDWGKIKSTYDLFQNTSTHEVR